MSKRAGAVGVGLIFILAMSYSLLGRRSGMGANENPEVGIESIESLFDETGPEDMSDIIGGSVAQTSRYPYYCFLLMSDSNGPVAACGGSLIHVDIVLTAAHCVLDENEQKWAEITAYCGVSDSFTPSSRQPSESHMRRAEKWEAASTYKPDTLLDDYAIIKLEHPINGVQTVAVNSESSVPVDGEAVTAVGFGRTSTGGSTPNDLLEVDITVLNPSECADKIPGYDDSAGICAHDFAKGVCQGDSGGPLVIPGSDASSDVQVALTSFTFGGCADQTPNFPDGYARVSAWYENIVEFTCAESVSPSTSPLCSGTSPTSPTHTDTESDSDCSDRPAGWEDSVGDGCHWYARGNRCKKYGDGYVNQHKTAKEACCVCGGGGQGPAPTCNNVPGWVDKFGEKCDWYASENRCGIYGHRFRNHGKTANAACCVCGGGQ